MITFTTKILTFAKAGEKTGWSYIFVPAKHAAQLNPGCRRSFRVRGKLDGFKLERTALLPRRSGGFIMFMNEAIRKGTGKTAGDHIRVAVQLDTRPPVISKDFITCLQDDERAYSFFKELPRGHQNYFSNWIEGAKTVNTKTKRITMAIFALGDGKGFGEMMKGNKKAE